MNDASWIRFVNTRHPLSRLYSGWNSNLGRKTGPAEHMYKDGGKFGFSQETS